MNNFSIYFVLILLFAFSDGIIYFLRKNLKTYQHIANFISVILFTLIFSEYVGNIDQISALNSLWFEVGDYSHGKMAFLFITGIGSLALFFYHLFTRSKVIPSIPILNAINLLFVFLANIEYQIAFITLTQLLYLTFRMKDISDSKYRLGIIVYVLFYLGFSSFYFLDALAIDAFLTKNILLLFLTVLLMFKILIFPFLIFDIAKPNELLRYTYFFLGANVPALFYLSANLHDYLIHNFQLSSAVLFICCTVGVLLMIRVVIERRSVERYILTTATLLFIIISSLILFNEEASTVSLSLYLILISKCLFDSNLIVAKRTTYNTVGFEYPLLAFFSLVIFALPYNFSPIYLAFVSYSKSHIHFFYSFILISMYLLLCNHYMVRIRKIFRNKIEVTFTLENTLYLAILFVQILAIVYLTNNFELVTSNSGYLTFLGVFSVVLISIMALAIYTPYVLKAKGLIASFIFKKYTLNRITNVKTLFVIIDRQFNKSRDSINSVINVIVKFISMIFNFFTSLFELFCELFRNMKVANYNFWISASLLIVCLYYTYLVS